MFSVCVCLCMGQYTRAHIATADAVPGQRAPLRLRLRLPHHTHTRSQKTGLIAARGQSLNNSQNVQRSAFGGRSSDRAACVRVCTCRRARVRALRVPLSTATRSYVMRRSIDWTVAKGEI